MLSPAKSCALFNELPEGSASVTIGLPYQDTGGVFPQLDSSVGYKNGGTFDLQEVGDMYRWTENGKSCFLLCAEFEDIML